MTTININIPEKQWYQKASFWINIVTATLGLCDIPLIVSCPTIGVGIFGGLGIVNVLLQVFMKSK